jgi:hypothetical protein
MTPRITAKNCDTQGNDTQHNGTLYYAMICRASFMLSVANKAVKGLKVRALLCRGPSGATL